MCANRSPGSARSVSAGGSPATRAALRSPSTGPARRIRASAGSAIASARTCVAALVLSFLAFGGLLLAEPARAQALQIPFHATDKTLMVEDITELNLWLLGWLDPIPSPRPTPGVVARLNAGVPALVKAMTATGDGRVVTFFASAPMGRAMHVSGVRITYATKTIAAGRVETPPLATGVTPKRIAAGKAVTVKYDLRTGQITVDQVN